MSSESIWVKRGDKVFGPFAYEKIAAGFKVGKVTRTDVISESQSGPWTTIMGIVARHALAGGDQTSLPPFATAFPEKKTPSPVASQAAVKKPVHKLSTSDILARAREAKSTGNQIDENGGFEEAGAEASAVSYSANGKNGRSHDDRVGMHVEYGEWECPRCGSNDTYEGTAMEYRSGPTFAREVGDTGMYMGASTGGYHKVYQTKCRNCSEELDWDDHYLPSSYEEALWAWMDRRAMKIAFAIAGVFFFGVIALLQFVVIPAMLSADPDLNATVLWVPGGCLTFALAAVLWRVVFYRYKS